MPLAMPIAQQQAEPGIICRSAVLDEHLGTGRPPGALVPVIPPPFVDRPRPGPPAQLPVVAPGQLVGLGGEQATPGWACLV